MAIDRFEGDYHFLSNFYESPLAVPGLGVAGSVEHAYQALKSTKAHEQSKVMNAGTPGEAKKLGRKLDLRPDWEQVKLPIMRDLIIIKFFWGTKLSQKLIGTGDAELIEGNWWGDTFWGVCKGEGLNCLGQILMRHRAELRGSVWNTV